MVHFETFHEIFQPTYASEYPPGQSLFMAFGQRFLGHPWFGLCISFGLMCGCLCWMLQGILVAMGEFSLFGYWMDSYWGAVVGTMGGSLVVGAVSRLAKSTSASASWLASLGLMILALSRPFEELLVTFAGVAGLLWWRHRLGRRVDENLCSNGRQMDRGARPEGNTIDSFSRQNETLSQPNTFAFALWVQGRFGQGSSTSTDIRLTLPSLLSRRTRVRLVCCVGAVRHPT
jgi:hypothetical protein